MQLSVRNGRASRLARLALAALCALLAPAMAVCALAADEAAAVGDALYAELADGLEPNIAQGVAILSDAETAEDAEAALRAFREGIWRGDAEIALYAQDYPTLTYVDAAHLTALLEKYPDTFAFGKDYSFKYSYENSVANWRFILSPVYTMSGTDYENAKAVYTQGIGGIVGQVNAAGLATDLEKVLFVNNHLGLHFQYDPRYETVDPALYNYDVYSLFRDGYGVCEAYTATVEAVLEQLGIPCSWCKSESLDHIWNIVKLGSDWYHLDTTWNDPTPDRPGSVRYTYFLLSEAAMRDAARKHFKEDDWQYGRPVECDSTTYDDGHCWAGAISPLTHADGAWYYVSADGLMRAGDGFVGEPQEMVSFEEEFAKNYPNRVVSSAYAWRSGLFWYAGKLVFNDWFSVHGYDPATDETELLVDSIDNAKIQSCLLHGRTPAYCIEDEIIPFTLLCPVADGGYSYCFDGATLRVDVTADDTLVVAAWYDSGSGRMLGCQTFSAVGETAVETSGTVRLFALNKASGVPRTPPQ